MATRLVALLRGINVGTAKRVAMAQLRDLLTELGYSDVRTLLNSGNVVFTSASSDTTDTTVVATQIEQAIARQLNVQCRVIVRTAADLAAAVAANPILARVSDPSRHLVGFLDGAPDPTRAEAIATLAVPPDEVQLVGQQLYLWCPDGILVSTLNKVPWERQLGMAVTMRNWNTVLKLAALASG